MKVKSFIKWKLIVGILKFKPLSNTIFFESFMGNKVSCNPLAIYEMLKNDNFNFVWVVNNSYDFEDENVIKVKKNSLKYVFYLTTSKWVVLNGRLLTPFNKRKGQIVLQTWHGTPLKKLVYDMHSFKMGSGSKERYLKNFDKEVKLWDCLIAPNEYSAKIFKNAFKYNGKIIRTGYPRNINLCNDEKFQLNNTNNKKVYLYTPTFRDDVKDDNGKYLFNLDFNFEKFNRESGCILLVRTHYLISQNLNIDEYENIIDVSLNDNINELYKMADGLITDYSSTMFDYNILKRPIIIYAPDFKNYEVDLRGFYLELTSLTSNITTDMDTLLDIIKKGPKNDFSFEIDEKCDEKMIKEIFEKENV